eukprot:jgi/Psemu1/293535/fgenesh1_pg.2626_\
MAHSVGLTPPFGAGLARERALGTPRSSVHRTTAPSWLGCTKDSVAACKETRRERANATNCYNVPPVTHQKSHSLSVCLVPPSPDQIRTDSCSGVVGGGGGVKLLWEALTEMRRTLRDPGFFRWPPHVNLLYPFVREEEDCIEAKNNNHHGDERLTKLRTAAESIEPFRVTLDLDPKTFATFGDATRGVLWVSPKSHRADSRSHQGTCDPIAELQSLLEAEFPVCSESLKDRSFVPHMSLSSKFDSLEGARSAAKSLAEARASGNHAGKNTVVSFWCKEFYLLERDGDGGQFRKRATIALGSSSSGDGIHVHDPPQRFLSMPAVEEAWVREEYLLLRARRKHNSRTNSRKRGSGGPSRRNYRARKRWKKQQQETFEGKMDADAPIWHDTANIVAQKRAERRARRAQIEAQRSEPRRTVSQE